MKYGVLWDVNDLGYLAVEAAVAMVKGELEAAEGTFASALGDKEIVTASDGGLELLLGDALTFGPENVEDYHY